MGQKENFKWSIDFKQECWISFSTNICFEVKNHYIEDEIEIFCPFSKRQELVSDAENLQHPWNLQWVDLMP